MSDENPLERELDQRLKMIAFLIERAGGEVVISQREFLDFPEDCWIESTLDVDSGVIRVTTGRT